MSSKLRKTNGIVKSKSLKYSNTRSNPILLNDSDEENQEIHRGSESTETEGITRCSLKKPKKRKLFHQSVERIILPRRVRDKSSSEEDDTRPSVVDPHPFLQFEQGSEAHKRFKRLVGKEIVEPRTIDWQLLDMVGAKERAINIIGVQTPWRRMFDLGGLPAYREIILEFLSTFHFSPPQTGGLQDIHQHDAVSFTLCGQACTATLPIWGALLGFYSQEEVTTPMFLDAHIREDEAVLAEWWPLIGDEAFITKARVSRIRDPLHRYLHRCIAYTIAGRRMGQEWVTRKDLFYIYCLIGGHNCNLAWLLADYFSSLFNRKATSAITCGSYVTRIAQQLNRFSAVVRAGMTHTYQPSLLGRETVMLMHIAAEVAGHGLRFSLDRKHVWKPLQSPPQPHLSEQPPPDQSSPGHAPLDQPPPAQLPPQHPPLEQPLPTTRSAYADILREHAAQLDRIEDMMRWLVDQLSMASGIPVPVFIRPRHPPQKESLPHQPSNEPQHRVVQQPRLAYADILREHATKLDRVEYMVRWLVEQQAMASDILVPVFIRPRQDPDPQDPPDHD